MGFINNDGLSYFWQKLKAILETKVDKEEGKGLSTNDYTTAEKTKLANIADGANKTVVENVLTSTSSANALSAAQGKILDEKISAINTSLADKGAGDMLKSVYDADNDGIVDNSAKLGGQLPAYYAKAEDIPTNVSDLANDAGYLTEHQDISGKLDKTGDGSNVTAAFTQATSRVNIATGEKLSVIVGKVSKWFADLKTVAFTGSYNDLTDKPAIPTVTNDLTNALKANYDAAYTHSQADHAPANAQANIIESVKVNGVAQSIADKAVDITVPTDNADLANGAGYLVATDIANKADKATSLAGYGITDAYTKAQTDSAISTAKQEAIEAVLDGVTEDFDTLKEVAAWIQADTTNSAALVARVTAIENDYLTSTDLVAITNAEIDAIMAS